MIEFETDDRLGLGEFGIQTRVAQPDDEPVSAPRRGRSRGARWSTAPPSGWPSRSRSGPAHPARAQKALLLVDGKRLVVGPSGATLGRGRQCDVVLNDPNVSRQHAEIRPRGGSWVLTDLGSTNGSQLNGRRIDGSEVLRDGDEIELGESAMTFTLE